MDECGSAVILKNNVPRYLIIDFSKADKDLLHLNEMCSISKQLMEQNKEAYEVWLNEKTEQKQILMLHTQLFSRLVEAKESEITIYGTQL